MVDAYDIKQALCDIGAQFPDLKGIENQPLIGGGGEGRVMPFLKDNGLVVKFYWSCQADRLLPEKQVLDCLNSHGGIPGLCIPKIVDTQDIEGNSIFSKFMIMTRVPGRAFPIETRLVDGVSFLYARGIGAMHQAFKRASGELQETSFSDNYFNRPVYAPLHDSDRNVLEQMIGDAELTEKVLDVFDSYKSIDVRPTWIHSDLNNGNSLYSLTDPDEYTGSFMTLESVVDFGLTLPADHPEMEFTQFANYPSQLPGICRGYRDETGVDLDPRLITTGGFLTRVMQVCDMVLCNDESNWGEDFIDHVRDLYAYVSDPKRHAFPVYTQAPAA